jgi:hypothetical protein
MDRLLFRAPLHRTLTLAAMAATLGCVFLAQHALGAAPQQVDFTQCANADPTVGSCHWINSILIPNNSAYAEGKSVPQRILLTNIPASSGSVHTLTFAHQATKGGVHAYDFLVGYNQGNVPALTLNPCSDFQGSLGATCAAIRAANSVNAPVMDDMFVSKDGPTIGKIATFEASFGNREIQLFGDAPLSGATVTLSHDVAASADTGDSYVWYTLTWTSASTDVLVEMAGHIAISGDGTGMTWGPGLGAGSISGGPYHFKLDQLDGSALGAQDNQIQSSVISGGSSSSSVSSSSVSSAVSSAASSVASSASSVTSSVSSVASSVSSVSSSVSSVSSSVSSVASSSSSAAVSSISSTSSSLASSSSSVSSSASSVSVSSASSAASAVSSAPQVSGTTNTGGGGGSGGGGPSTGGSRGQGTTTTNPRPVAPPSFGGSPVTPPAPAPSPAPAPAPSVPAQIPPPSYGGAYPGVPNTGHADDLPSYPIALVLLPLAAIGWRVTRLVAKGGF